MQLQGRNLQSGLSGEDVAALHRELMFLGYTIPEDERRGWFFGAGTAQVVAAFQQAYRLRASGIVDTPTAQALGQAVAAVGTRAESPPTREYPAPVVEDQAPAPEPPAPGASPRGAEFAGPEPPAAPRRGDQPTGPAPPAGEGDEPQPVTRPTASESLTELAKESDAAEEREAVQEQVTGQTDAEAVQGMEEEDQDSGAQPEPDQDDGGVGEGDDGEGSDDGEDEPSLTELKGRLMSDRRISAEGVTLRFYERGFGGRSRELGGTVTDVKGRFSISVRLSGLKGTFLDVRAVGPDDQEVRLIAPGRRIDLSKPVNLVMPVDKLSSPHQSEHDRLQEVLAPHLGDIKLSEAKEDDEQQDITLLHEATGWDARLIALGASAAKLAEESEIEPKALYGMLRAGLPTRKNQLIQITHAGVGHALRKAAEAGVVTLDEQEIEVAQEQFEQFARRERRHLAAPGTPSSYGALLKAAGLDQTQQDRVDEIFTGHTGDPEELWEKTEAAGLPTDQLKLTAQVAGLTGNSARLVENLRERAGSFERLGQSLVNDRLYEPGAWADRLRELANGDETVLGKMIPPAYEAENLDERLDAYTVDLAREIQTSYPTRVVGRKVATGELRLRDIPIGEGVGDDEGETGEGKGVETRAGGTDADGAAAPPPPPLASEQVRLNVASVMERAADRDFELGVTPLHQFLNAHNEELFTGISQEQAQVATRQVETLQRLYQITPSDGALQALEDSGLASAHQIAELPRERFLQRFEDRFPSQVEADLTWIRAQQVDAVTLNMVTTVKQSISNVGGLVMHPGRQFDPEDLRPDIDDLLQGDHLQPPLGESQPPLDGPRSPSDGGQVAETIKQFPTLERLFGSLDYPECDHCESVLSPAAYFVDLLRFLDKRPTKGRRPYLALRERRRDLAHIELTCDNTETALPYIDIVNEVLERFVASGQVTPAAALGNDGASSEDLIAEPRHVLPAAYSKLNEARYPLELPFDLWLETVRAFSSHLETPFWQVLEALRTGDELHPSAAGDDVGYGRASVAYERLGFSPDDIDILTSTDPQAAMPELYGEPLGTSASAARTKLAPAKVLARRLGVSYHELVDLVSTAFLNPRLDTLAALRSYGVSTTEARLYLAAGDQSLTPQQRQDFEQKLGTEGLDWLQGAWNDGDFARIVVLADPELGDGPEAFDTTELRMGDGSLVHPMVLALLNYFVRIWRRLGWSIDEVDRALTGCLPEEPNLDTPAALGPAMATALLGLAYLDELTERLGTGRQGRTELLGLWASLDDERYQELFPGEPLPPEFLEIADQSEEGGASSAPDGTQPVPLQLTQAVEGLHTLRPVIATLPNTVALNVLRPGLLPHLPPDVQVPQTLGSSVPVSVPNLAALRAELGLTAEEVRLVLGATSSADGSERNVPPAEAEAQTATRTTRLTGVEFATQDTLSLETVSALYRYALLARLLDLKIGDLVVLVGLSGVDPFTPPADGPGALAAGDHSGRHTLRFVELVQTVQASGLSAQELDYLLHHRFDPVGPYRRANRPPLELVRTLAAEITRIRSEHAVPADGLAFTDEVLARELALVVEPEVAATFLDLWTGVRRLGDPGSGSEGATGLVPRSFVDDHLARRLVEGVGWVGFLKTEGLDLDAFFTPTPNDQDAERSRRQKLATDLLPYLQERLIHRLVVDTVASGVTSEPELVDTLLTDPSVLDDPEQPGRSLLNAYVDAGSHGLTVTVPPDESPKPEPGPRPDPGGRPLLPDTRSGPGKLPDTGTVTKPGSHPDGHTRRGILIPKPPASKIPGVPTRPLPGTRPQPSRPESWHQVTGYLEVPASGHYRLSVRCPQPGIQVKLTFAALPDPLIQAESTKVDLDPFTVVELEAGFPYSFTLDHSGGNEGADAAGAVTLWLEGTELPKRQVTDVVTYPRAQVERLHRLHLLVTKALLLVNGLGLTEPELRHLARHPGDFDGLDLGQLPVRSEDVTAERVRSLFGQVLRMAGWTQLRDTLRADPEDLLDLVSRARRNPAGESPLPSKIEAHQAAQATLDDLYQHAGMVMRRDPEIVREAAELLGMTAGVVDGQVEAPGFASELGLKKLWRVLSLAHRLGADPAALGHWATPAPDEEVARDVRAAVKARFQPEAWRRVVQPVSDRLRKRKRDALVAHIVRTEGFDRMEQLFEYFLLDPGTEPVVRTSRLRLAISSVQTFVQRCFLGLEVNDEASSKSVHPSALDAEQWEWMKRYRVWEANRKIFLWPENWLEPELRDEKSPLFKTMESQLLETDLDEEHAEIALTQYLRGLEEVARLDVRSVYEEGRWETIERGQSLGRLHVLARTFNEPHKYFYRTRSNRKWSPWLPVAADITGDQVAMAYWNNRVQLFWVTFLEKPVPSDEEFSSGLEALRPTSKEVTAYLHWVDYHQGHWSDAAVTALGTRIDRADRGTDLGKVSAHVAAPGETLWSIQMQVQGQVMIPFFEPITAGKKLVVVDVPRFSGEAMIGMDGLFNTVEVRSRTSATPVWSYKGIRRRTPPYFSVGSNLANSSDSELRGHGLTRTPHGWAGDGPLGVELQVHWFRGGEYADDAETTFARQPNHHLLRDSIGWYTLVIAHDEGQSGRPFFYGDRYHSFFVEPVWLKWSTPSGLVITVDNLADEVAEGTGVSVVDEGGIASVIEDTIHETEEPNIVLPGPQPDVITTPGRLVTFGDRLITATGGQFVHPVTLSRVQDRPKPIDQLQPEVISGIIPGRGMR